MRLFCKIVGALVICFVGAYMVIRAGGPPWAGVLGGWALLASVAYWRD